MGKLSISKYAWLCVLGGEIIYTVCVTYGLFLSGATAALHLSLFRLLPGFSGMNFSSWFLGAISIAVWSGIGGTYVAWMHNASIERR